MTTWMPSGSVALCERAFAAVRLQTRTLVNKEPARPRVRLLPSSVLTGLIPDDAG
jgi:hypothetical protein